MDVIKYFLKVKTLIYFAVSFIFGIYFSFVTNMFLYYKTVPLFFTLFYLFRIADDYFDYEKDKKAGKIRLEKEKLKILFGIFLILFLVLNFINYAYKSCFEVIIVVLIIAEQRIKIIQLFMGVSVVLFYLLMYKKIWDLTGNEIMFLAIVFVFSLVFVFYKRRRA
jgi:hypothetical protein